jgi:hypothetical protein
VSTLQFENGVRRRQIGDSNTKRKGGELMAENAFRIIRDDMEMCVDYTEEGYVLKIINNNTGKEDKMFVQGDNNLPEIADFNKETMDRAADLMNLNITHDPRLFKDFYFLCKSCGSKLNMVITTDLIGTILVDQKGISVSKDNNFYGNISDFISNIDTIHSLECKKCSDYTVIENFSSIPFTDGKEVIYFGNRYILLHQLLRDLVLTHYVEEEHKDETAIDRGITKQQAMNTIKLAYPDATDEEIANFLDELYDYCEQEDIENGFMD